MEVGSDFLFFQIGRLTVENEILKQKVTDLEKTVAASQLQVKLLMEQVSKTQPPKEG